MTSSRILVGLVVASTGCVGDVPTLDVETNAAAPTELAPPDDHIPAAFGHYHWALVTAPPSAKDPLPTEQAPTIVIKPTMRGIYVYDRWFAGQSADELSYHVVVTVHGVPPIARIAGPTMVAVGAATTLDGSSSGSLELRPVTHQWRLATRAESSMTVLAETDGDMLTLVPDVVGEYSIELRVFDGELWSAPATTTLTAR